MTEHVNVAVSWKSERRTVMIRFDIEPVVMHVLPSPPPNRPTIGPLQIESKASLLQFLADLTKHEPDGTVVLAGLMDVDKPEFLEYLGVSTVVPDPIKVTL
jgi:hypothetical protein